MKQKTKVTFPLWRPLYQKSRWRGLFSLIIILAALLSVMFLAVRVSATAVAPPPASISQPLSLPPFPSALPSALPAAQTAIDCNVNPFGAVHDLMLEQEIFVSVTATFGMNPNVTSELLDEGMPQGTAVNLMEEALYYENANSNGMGVTTHAATAADLDGNGRSEFIQTFANGNDEWYLAYYNDPLPAPPNPVQPVYYRVSSRRYTPVVAAAGYISDANGGREQIVLAGVDQVSGKVNLLLWDGANSGGGIIVAGRWSSTTGGRSFATLLDLTIGDFTGDGQDEIVLLMKQSDGDMELVLLDYDASQNSGSGDDVAYRLKPLANIEFNPADLSRIQVMSGRLNGDLRDEIIVAFNDINADDQSILLFAFEYDPLNFSLTQLTSYNENITYVAGSFDMAAGMGEVNGDFLREEVVLSYPDDNGLHVQVFGAQALTTTTPSFAIIYDWYYPWSTADGITDARYLSLDVGDMNQDGLGEIVAAFDDGRGLRVIDLSRDNLTANTLTKHINLDPANLNTRTDIVLGDVENDSIRAVYNGDCRVIKEDNVDSVIYRPPIWQNIQQRGFESFATGFIGRSNQNATTQEEKLGHERSTTISGFVGVGVEIGPFEANARATMAEEYIRSGAQGSSQTTSITDAIQDSSGFNFVVGDEATYYCYGYQVMQNGAPITNTTSIRSCELKSSVFQSTPLAVRDVSAAIIPTSANQSLEWTPTVRDWESIALFCDSCISQSSTSSGAVAAKAVDGILDGETTAMTATTVENYPWLEIDLGQSEAISKIRLWHNDQSACQANSSCAPQLKDVYVFVSDTPFAPTDTPADLLNDAAVNSYSLSTINTALSPTVGTDFPAGRVTTFLTLQTNFTVTSPIQGRYIRVQIDRPNAALHLAEVQVFGPDHVEPNRYPLAVRSGGTDYFEVQMYDPRSGQNKWVQIRGQLLWNGQNNSGNLVTRSVGSGETISQWSRLSEQTNSQFTQNSIAENRSVGVEFDLALGGIAKVQAGGGVEFGAGVFSETTHTASWTSSFELGGSVTGFPQVGNGGTIVWPTACNYNIHPYYYTFTEESSFGYKSQRTVLDYFVTGLDRTADLFNCESGYSYNPTSNANNDTAAGTTTGNIFIYALANDGGTANLRITFVSDPPHGTTTFTDSIITYTPDVGFIGDDTFTYTIGDGVTSSTGTVTVTVNPVQVFLPTVIR